MPYILLTYLVDFIIAFSTIAVGLYLFRLAFKVLAYPFIRKRRQVNKKPLHKTREQNHWKTSIKANVLHKVAEALPRKQATPSKKTIDASASDSVTSTESSELKDLPDFVIQDYKIFDQPTFQRKNVVLH